MNKNIIKVTEKQVNTALAGQWSDPVHPVGDAIETVRNAENDNEPVGIMATITDTLEVSAYFAVVIISLYVVLIFFNILAMQVAKTNV